MYSFNFYMHPFPMFKRRKQECSLRIFFPHFGKHCFCVIGSNEGARSMSHKLSFADRRHAFADIRYWNTCMQQNQSRYKEVPQLEIFMEQKLSFGLGTVCNTGKKNTFGPILGGFFMFSWALFFLNFL